MASILAFYALAVLSMTLSALSQTALWQRKEYRVDRVRSYLLSPEKSVQDIVIWALAFVCAVMAFIFSFFAYTAVLVLLVGYGVRAVQRGVSRPVFTMRAIAVLVNTGVLALLAFSSTANIVWVSLVAVFMPLVVAITVGIIALPAMIQKKSVMNRAITYRKNLKNLQVIGITGSVGKTSTKTYAMHILQGNDKNIVATHEHRNSPYVVAQDMMMHVSEKTNTYIAELGAYRKGEIAELCEIVQPTIGVITAITNQHAGLFGSVEELAQTKWELADAIPDTGTLVLNKGNEIIRSKSAGVHKKIIWYSLKNSADVIFEQILIQQDHVEVVLMISGESYPVRIPVVSEGQLSSVLAACAVAYAVGVSASDIAKRLETLPVLPKTMEYKVLGNKAIIIDDSYSASEASVINAIEYLKKVGDETSLLVLLPIIELGDEGLRVHERIGAALTQVSFKTFIYGTAYQEDVMRGFAHAPHAHVTWYRDAKVLARDVAKHVAPNTLTVFEGRLPGIVTNI